MIPDSLTAVLSFLLLIAPGIVWELQRTRHEPAVKESALIELSRVILASLAFTGAVTIFGLLYWFPLVQEVVSHGRPVLEFPDI